MMKNAFAAVGKKKVLTEAEIQQQKKEMFELEQEFSDNLARIYNKAAHKSGVQGCHKLID
jgi:hypothetical protein